MKDPPIGEKKSHSLIKTVAKTCNMKYRETKPGFTTEQALKQLGYHLDMDTALGKGAFGMVLLCRRIENRRENRISFSRLGTKPSKPLKMFTSRNSTLKNENSRNLPTNETIFACKIIDGTNRTERRVRDLDNELNALRNTVHPFIIRYFDDFIIDTKFYIIMEYAESGNLKHYMGKYGRLDEKRARRWFRQILSALEYLHTRVPGIAHRDLKGENVLLKREWFEGKVRRVCKLSDFGLSAVSFTVEEGPIYASTACGTRPYMAPEVLGEKARKKKPYDSTKADIWALGVILFQMITNQYPFNFEDLGTMIQLQKEHQLNFSKAPKASEEVKDLLHQILDPDPSSRLTIIGIKSHPWLADQSQSDSFDSKSSSSSSGKARTSNSSKRFDSSKEFEGKNVIKNNVTNEDIVRKRKS